MAAYTFPVTRDEVEYVLELVSFNPNPVMAVAAIGLTPMFPTIEVVPVVVIPDLDRITKFAAFPRYTRVGPRCVIAAYAGVEPICSVPSIAIIMTSEIPKILFILILLHVIFYEPSHLKQTRLLFLTIS